MRLCCFCKHRDDDYRKDPCISCMKSKEDHANFEPANNGVVIRNKSDEKLALFMAENAACNRCTVNEAGLCPKDQTTCYEAWLRYLRKEPVAV